MVDTCYDDRVENYFGLRSDKSLIKETSQLILKVASIKSKRKTSLCSCEPDWSCRTVCDCYGDRGSSQNSGENAYDRDKRKVDQAVVSRLVLSSVDINNLNNENMQCPCPQHTSCGPDTECNCNSYCPSD